MEIAAKNEWLAELLMSRRELVTSYWIEDIRTEGIPGYELITDEQLRADLPPTVDSMIQAFQTGDTEGPRMHSVGVIQRRLADGLLLPDLQMSLHALETAVMRVVKEANVGLEREFEALTSTSTMYYVVALIAAAVYEQLRAEQRRRFDTAYELGTILSQTLDMDAILDLAVRKVAEYTDAGSVAIMLATPDGSHEVRAYHNLDDEVIGSMHGICASLGCCEGEIMDGHDAARAVADVRAYDRLDRWSGLLASHRCLSLVCTPLLAQHRPLGRMVVLWPEVRPANRPLLDYLLALAGHIATAVQNAMLYEEARAKRELGTLLQASRLFASSLDTHDILRKIARMATEAVGADLAVVLVTDRPRAGPAGMAHYARGKEASLALKRSLAVVAPEWERDGLGSLGAGLAKGRPSLFGGRSEFPDRLQPLAKIIGSGLSIPIRHKQSLLGAFVLASLEEGALSEADIPLATGLADLAAVAIENARLYQYEKNISETLQRSFLPSSVPGIQGYEVGAYYRPAMSEAAVGGDFYDFFPAARGRMGFTIGDVSGKGIAAAAPTAMGKYMIRAFGIEDASPARVLERFNRAFCDSASEDLFMTVLCGVLDPAEHVLTYASAGHNPPLLYSANKGSVSEALFGGICIGVSSEQKCRDDVISLQPGDVVLLYTDGATDVKHNGQRLDIEGLRDLFLANARSSAEEIIAAVSSGILSYGRGKLADDVALVVLKRLA